MRILPVFAATACLAATPCLAQVVVQTTPDSAGHQEHRAIQQGNAAGRDEMKADMNVLQGNFGAANRDENAAMAHTDSQVRHENNADMDAVTGH